MTIDWEEMQDSPTEGAGPQGVYASMQVMCAWEDRFDLLAEFLDNLTPYPHNTALTIVAISGSVQPFGGSADAGDGLVEYEKAVVTINFGPMGILASGGTDPSDLYSESIEPYVDSFPLPVRTGFTTLFSWTADGANPLAEREAPVRQFKGVTYVFTKFNQATIPTEALTLVGCVNASAVTAATLGVTFEAETLLMLPPTITRTMRTDGTSGWTIVYKFMYKPNFDTVTGDALGWNYFYWAEGDNFGPMYRRPASGTWPQHLVYPTGNFATL